MLDRGALATYIYRLRIAHQESGEEPHFFLTRNHGEPAVAWHRPLTWLRIEHVAPNSQALL